MNFSTNNQADPAEGATEAEWPFRPDPNWFTPKQKP